MWKKYGIALMTTLVLTFSASAIVPPTDGTMQKSRPEWVRAPELGAQPSLDRVERDNPRAIDFPGVAKFFGTYSTNWNVTWDTRSDRAHLIQGPGVPWNGLEQVDPEQSSRHLETVVGQTRTFMAENWELFGVDHDDLVLDESQSGVFGKDGQLTFITFQQTYEGIPVEDAIVFFRFNQGKLRSFGTVRVADVHMSTHANVDQDEALQRVLDHAGISADELTELLVDGELKIVPTLPPGESAGHAYVGAPGLGYRHTLVREVSFRREGDAATYLAQVDAKSGRILKLVDANDYAVTGGVVDFTYGSETVRTFPTNVNGSNLDGVNFRMSDNCGAISVTPSGGNYNLGTSSGHDCSTPGFGGAGNTRSSRGGMYHLTSIRNEASTYYPTNSWLNSKVTVNMNINNTCNAYWNGSSVNFYRSGGGCGNTGEIPAVFLHEWGHGFDSNTGGAASDRASGEAVGDVFAALYAEDPCIGPGFLSSPCYNCTSCTGVRDLEDFSLYGTKVRATPANITNNSGINCDRYSCPYTGYAGVMGYEGHCEATIAGSALWNLTQDIGFQATKDLWYPSMVPTKSYAQIQSGGTCNPNATINGCGATNWYSVLVDLVEWYSCIHDSIWVAFNAQGIACGTRPVITCNDGLFCNGAETCVAGKCQAGSDPCPAGGIEGCDEVADVCTCDEVESFETSSGGWQQSGDCTYGQFIRDIPNEVIDGGVTTQPDGAYEGTYALFTQPNTTAGSHDVDGGECISTSPVYNAGDKHVLSVWYFHGQRDNGDDPGDSFHLEVNVNSGGWTDLASYGDETVNAVWTEAIGQVLTNESFQLRIRAADPGTGTLGDLIEAGIDGINLCGQATLQ